MKREKDSQSPVEKLIIEGHALQKHIHAYPFPLGKTGSDLNLIFFLHLCTHSICTFVPDICKILYVYLGRVSLVCLQHKQSAFAVQNINRIKIKNYSLLSILRWHYNIMNIALFWLAALFSSCPVKEGRKLTLSSCCSSWRSLIAPLTLFYRGYLVKNCVWEVSNANAITNQQVP